MAKTTKIAEISINGTVIDINGDVKEGAWVYVKNYDESRTHNLIEKIETQEYLIKSKLERKGYIFNDEIGIGSVEAEVIKHLISHCFNIQLECYYELGQLGNAIFINKDFCRHDGRRLEYMVEDLYRKHFGIA